MVLLVSPLIQHEVVSIHLEQTRADSLPRIARLFDLLLELLQILDVLFFLDQYRRVDQIISALLRDQFHVQAVHFLEDRGLVSQLEFGAAVNDRFPVLAQYLSFVPATHDLPRQFVLDSLHVAVPGERLGHEVLERRILHDVVFYDLVRLAHFELPHTCQRVTEHPATENDGPLDQHIGDSLSHSI